MNYMIEERPQSQPGACCLTGIHEDEYFIRLITPDAFLGSLVISKTAFHQLASELGYVQKDESNNQIQEIKELQNALDYNLADLSARVDTALRPLLSLQEILRYYEQLAAAVERAAGQYKVIDGSPIELRDGTPESAEGSSESTSDSQLDGIFSIGSKRGKSVPGSSGKN